MEGFIGIHNGKTKITMRKIIQTQTWNDSMNNLIYFLIKHRQRGKQREEKHQSPNQEKTFWMNHQQTLSKSSVCLLEAGMRDNESSQIWESFRYRFFTAQLIAVYLCILFEQY